VTQDSEDSDTVKKRSESIALWTGIVGLREPKNIVGNNWDQGGHIHQERGSTTMVLDLDTDVVRNTKETMRKAILGG
jgi:hypothetical protein